MRTCAASHTYTPKKCLTHPPASSFLKKFPHPHTNSLQLRLQKYKSNNEEEPMNYVEQAKTLVQTLIHFFQLQDKTDELDSNKSKKKSFLLKKFSH